MKRTNNKCIVTTSWDDGHKLDLKLAKLLLKFNIRGTFFVSLNYINQPLSKKDLNVLSQDFEIGAHTITHAILTRIPLADAHREIIGSKIALEKLTNKRIYGFCYPRGAYNYEIVESVKEAGFLYGRTAERTSISISDPYKMGTTAYIFPICVRSIFKSILKMKSSFFSKTLGAMRKLPLNKTAVWLVHAKSLFDYVREFGGVWHLQGHSWEVNKFGLWDVLEEILEYVSNKNDVLYLTNFETISYFCREFAGSLT